MQNPPAGVRLVMEAVCIMKVKYPKKFKKLQIEIFNNINL
jgi:hypothetical protein